MVRNAPAVRTAQLTDFALYRIDDDRREASDLLAQEPERLVALAAKLESIYRELTRTMHVWPDLPRTESPPSQSRN